MQNYNSSKFKIYLLKIILILFTLSIFFPISQTSAAEKPAYDGYTAATFIQLLGMDDQGVVTRMVGPVDMSGEDKFGDELTETEKAWQVLSESADDLETLKDVLKSKKNKLDINEHDRRLLRQYLEVATLDKSGEDNSLLRSELKPYDIRILKLLEKLVLPESEGGAGYEYLKVDRIRRNYELERKQVSRETEEAENISAHTMGQAVDITAIDTTRCVAKGLFTKKKLKPFPIKVEWQADTRPGTGNIPFGDNFDEVAFEMAFSEIRDLFSGDKEVRANAWKWLFFEVGKSKLEDELDLETGSLDDTTQETFFKDLGLAMIAKKLEIPDFRALDGKNLEEISIKIALAFMETDLDLARGSLTSVFKPGMDWQGDWKGILTSVGKRKVETDLNLPRGTLDDPQKNKKQIEEAAINKYGSDIYKEADLAFNLPAGSAAKVKAGSQEVYAVIGASILADSLNYNDTEKEEIINNARNGVFANLHLGKKSFSLRLTNDEIGKIFTGNSAERKQILISSGTRLLDTVLQNKIISMDEEVRDALMEEIGVNRLYFSDVRNIVTTQYRRERLVYNVAAKKMENQFDLPEHSMKYALLRDSRSRNPEDIARSLENNFLRDIGEAHIEEVLGLQENQLQFNDIAELRANGILSRFSANPAHIDRQLSLSPGKTAELVGGGISFEEYKKEVGQIILGASIADSFGDGLNLPQIGDYQIKPSDLIGFFTGDWEDALLKVGANFAEEEFDLPSGTIYGIASREGSDPNQIFLAAGGKRLASIFNMENLDLQNINSTDDFKNSLGRQKIEQVLGLEPGTFVGTLKEVREKNINRFYQDPRTFDLNLNQRNLNPSIPQQDPKGFDILLDIPTGSTKKMLDSEISVEDFTKLVAERAIEIAGAIELWDRFGWAEDYKISGESLKNAIKNNDYVKLLSVFENISGFNLDNVFGFEKGTTSALVKAWNNETERNALLIEEGAKKLGDIIGLGKNDVKKFIRIYRNGDRSEEGVVLAAIQAYTEIPDNHADDVKSFTNGRIEQGLKFFTAALFVKQWQEKGVSFTYEDVREAVAFDNKDKQDLIAVAVAEYYLTKDNPWAKYLPVGFLRRWMESGKETDPDKAKKMQTDILFEWIGNLAMGGKLGEAFRGIDSNDLDRLYDFFLLPKDQRNNAELLKKLGDNGVFDAIDRNSEKWFGFRFQSGTANALFNYSVTDNFDAFIDNFVDVYENWGVEQIGGWLDDQLGLKTGTARELYQDYNYIKGLDNQFEAGKISETDLYAAVGARLFGKELAKFDDKLGLPPGFTQDVILGLATGNPFHLYKAAFNLLFGTWKVRCPDLTAKSKEKVKKFLGDILEIGEKDPTLIPSQIMTYSEQDVLLYSAQLDRLYPERRVPLANYGMGANPRMYDRVHIGY